MTDQLPRRFHLVRDIDETGTSGTGVVVEGLEFTDGTVALRWLTATTSTAIYASIADVETIHGHGGKTRVEWIDDLDDDALSEARRWARHGYEIGQRSCTWSDHGVAPAWLTDGWPHHFPSSLADDDPPTHDGPTVAELAANDRNWDVEQDGE